MKKMFDDWRKIPINENNLRIMLQEEEYREKIAGIIRNVGLYLCKNWKKGDKIANWESFKNHFDEEDFIKFCGGTDYAIVDLILDNKVYPRHELKHGIEKLHLIMDCGVASGEELYQEIIEASK